MTKKLLLLLVLIPLTTFAQQKKYRDAKGKACTPELADKYETEVRQGDSIHTIIKTYNLKDKLMHETSITTVNQIRDGKSVHYNLDDAGTVTWYANFKNGRRDGDSKTYYANGKIKRDEVFANDNLVTGKCFDENSNEIPYFEFEKKPEYPGGIKALYAYIGENFKPKGNASGKIIVQFVVEKDGSVTDLVVLKSLSKKMDDEALRVIQGMPKWAPGMQDGKPVRCQYQLPIAIAQ